MLLALPVTAVAQEKNQAITDPAKADADFAVQGEYSGELHENGKPQKYGVQVVALGKGKCRAVAYRGGLPGDGWDKSKRWETEGQTRDGATVVPMLQGTATIKDGRLTVTPDQGEKRGELKRVVRQSPTLGAKPSAGAVVLFDGSGMEHFLPGAKMTEEKLLAVPATTKRSFQGFQLHLEFRVPYRDVRGQGNSGVYLQGMYEIQILDSFGKAAHHHECGGIDNIRAPDVNMSLPPLSWQTYDVDFTAATFDAEGKVVKLPVVTIRHNGVVVHDQVELPNRASGTMGGRTKLSPGGGPLYFQNHGSPVHYRNIWLVEKK
jgi:hypothetical protein